MARIRLALQRGLARADTWVAAAGLFFGGYLVANDATVAGVLVTAVGLVFLVASGDFVWRKGFVAGRREGK